MSKGTLTFVIAMLLLASAFRIAGIVIRAQKQEREQQELVDRGLKAFDQKTGVLKWTDKAGGETFTREGK